MANVAAFPKMILLVLEGTVCQFYLVKKKCIAFLVTQCGDQQLLVAAGHMFFVTVLSL